MRFDADKVVPVDVIDEDGVECPLPRQQARDEPLNCVDQPSAPVIARAAEQRGCKGR